MLEVSGICLSLDAALPENVEMRTKEVARALGVSERDVCSAVLTRKSVDARKRNNVHFTTSFAWQKNTSRFRIPTALIPIVIKAAGSW